MPKSPRFSPNPIRAIEVLTFPAVQLLDVTGPVQVFASANDLVAKAEGAPPYRLKLVTQNDQGVVSSAGVTLAAGPLSRRSEALDTLLVAGGQGVDAAAANPALVDWLRQRAAERCSHSTLIKISEHQRFEIRRSLQNRRCRLGSRHAAEQPGRRWAVSLWRGRTVACRPVCVPKTLSELMT
jgi:hypothetical protein